MKKLNYNKQINTHHMQSLLNFSRDFFWGIVNLSGEVPSSRKRILHLNYFYLKIVIYKIMWTLQGVTYIKNNVTNVNNRKTVLEKYHFQSDRNYWSIWLFYLLPYTKVYLPYYYMWPRKIIGNIFLLNFLLFDKK